MLRDLLDALGHDRVTVVGHSLGGGIALGVAGYYPDRVQRLVLIAGGGMGREVHSGLRTERIAAFMAAPMTLQHDERAAARSAAALAPARVA